MIVRVPAVDWGCEHGPALGAPWWCMIPAELDLLEPSEELARWWPDDRLAEQVARGELTPGDGNLIWLAPERAAVWFPISAIAAETAARADQWRRQRRTPLNHWPPWM